MSVTRTAIFAATVALSSHAYAGTIGVSLTTAAGTQAAIVSLPDPDIARMVTAQKALEVARQHVKPGDPTPTPPTDAALLQTIANDVVKSLVRNTLGYERQQAARAAMKTVAPIATPQ